jgi:hypothetical protein
MLALAHKLQQAIDRGAVRDRADVARRLGLTRARVTQLLDLTLLAPDIQERILFSESEDGLEPVSERSVRGVLHIEDWAKQLEGCCFPDGAAGRLAHTADGHGQPG